MTMIRTAQPNWRAVGWILLIALSALGVSTSAQSRRGSGGLTVYADINFGGESASFRDDTPNLTFSGWNGRISSIRIPNGETWELCQDVDYRSQCRSLSGDVADLRSMGWNDRISSLRRANNNTSNNGTFGDRPWSRGNGNQNSGAGITVYANPNYGGQSVVLRDDTPNLGQFNLNDKISSIRVPAGETWELCQDADYGNQCQVLSASVADLRTMGWNDRISSLRRVNDGGFGGRRSGGGQGNEQSLLFYNRPGYRGTPAQVNAGSRNMGFSARQGSVQLRGGGAWELCDTSRNCATIDQDVSDVSNLGLKDRITSAHLVNNSQYRRNQ